MKQEEKMSFDEQKDDLLLRAAAMAYLEREGERLQNEILDAQKDESLQPDPQSIQKMRKTYSRLKTKQGFQKAAKRISYFAASLFLIAAVSFTVCYATVDAFREQVSNLFSHRTTQYTEFFTSTLSLPDTWKGCPVPRYVPDGYFVETERITESRDGTIVFSNGVSELTYSFYSADSTESIEVDSENAVHETVDIGENSADIYQREGYIAIILPENDFVYFITGDISKEEAIQMAESIAVWSE